MASAQRYLKEIEGAIKDAGVTHPHINFWINELKDIINEELPELAGIQLQTVYRFVSKKLSRRVIVTKENSKTWVMYETADSARPGTRWMIGKTWCTTGNIQRDSAQSYLLPEGLKIK